VHSGDFSKFNGFYNYTSTYRVDSDFPQFYQQEESFVWKENKSFNENYNFAQGKSALAAAVISNCHASSRKTQQNLD
jgi:phage-related protein